MNPHLENLQNHNKCKRVILSMIRECSIHKDQERIHSRHQFQEQQMTFVPNLILHLPLFNQGNLPWLSPSSSHQQIIGVMILTGLPYLPELFNQDLGVYPQLAL